MKFGRFQHQNRIFYGLVDGDQVSELEGSPFDSYSHTTSLYALSALKILTPCEPRNFYCAGLNYAAHIEWAAKRKGLSVKMPEKADVGYRSANALAATGEAIVIPADASDMVQFEGELVAVVGKTAKNLTVSIRVNGQPAAEYHTSKMLFSAQHFIARITQYMTLHPGDVIWLGTDGATEPDLRDGDVVEIEQRSIGILRSPVVRAKA